MPTADADMYVSIAKMTGRIWIVDLYSMFYPACCISIPGLDQSIELLTGYLSIGSRGMEKE